MGFLTNLANEGLYCAMVDAHYDRVAADICKRNEMGSLDVTNDLDSMTDEEYERDDLVEEPGKVTQSTDSMSELRGFSLLLKCAEDAKREREEEINSHLPCRACGYGYDL